MPLPPWQLLYTAAVETLRTLFLPPATKDDIAWSDSDSPYSPSSPQGVPISPPDLSRVSAEASASLPPLSPEHPQTNPRKGTARRRGASASKP